MLCRLYLQFFFLKKVISNRHLVLVWCVLSTVAWCVVWSVTWSVVSTFLSLAHNLQSEKD